MYENRREVLLPPACKFNVVNSVSKSNGLHIIELNGIQPVFDFFKAFSLPIQVSLNHPMRNTQFRPISTVSLSRRSLPAALPNPHLEGSLAYFFKQQSKVDLNKMNLADSDMDILVSEIITKRQCVELNLSNNRITYNGISTLAHTLRKNTVRESISYYLFSS